MFVTISFGGLVAEQMQYNLECSMSVKKLFCNIMAINIFFYLMIAMLRRHETSGHRKTSMLLNIHKN